MKMVMQNISVGRAKPVRKGPRSLMSAILTIASLLCTLLKPHSLAPSQPAHVEVTQAEACVVCKPKCIAPAKCNYASCSCYSRTSTEPTQCTQQPDVNVMQADAEQDVNYPTVLSDADRADLENLGR